MPRLLGGIWISWDSAIRGQSVKHQNARQLRHAVLGKSNGKRLSRSNVLKPTSMGLSAINSLQQLALCPWCSGMRISGESCSWATQKIRKHPKSETEGRSALIILGVNTSVNDYEALHFTRFNERLFPNIAAAVGTSCRSFQKVIRHARIGTRHVIQNAVE